MTTAPPTCPFCLREMTYHPRGEIDFFAHYTCDCAIMKRVAPLVEGSEENFHTAVMEMRKRDIIWAIEKFGDDIDYDLDIDMRDAINEEMEGYFNRPVESEKAEAKECKS